MWHLGATTMVSSAHVARLCHGKIPSNTKCPSTRYTPGNRAQVLHCYSAMPQACPMHITAIGHGLLCSLMTSTSKGSISWIPQTPMVPLMQAMQGMPPCMAPHPSQGTIRTIKEDS